MQARVRAPAHGLHHAPAAPRVVEPYHRRVEHRVLGRGEPLVGVANRQDHLGVRKGLGELPIEAARRRVGGGAPAGEKLAPVHRLAASRPLPHRPVLRMLERLAHVIAGAEAQLLQRQFLRPGRRARQARANHLERHPFPHMVRPIRPHPRPSGNPSAQGRSGASMREPHPILKAFQARGAPLAWKAFRIGWGSRMDAPERPWADGFPDGRGCGLIGRTIWGKG